MAEKSSSSSTEKSSSSRRNGAGGMKPAEVARAAVQTLVELTGRRPETVLGVRRSEDGWQVTVEVVELSRVPASTDLMGAYLVSLDESGEVTSYERSRRYQRGQVGGEQG
jgi:hypothetical protein